MTKQPILNALAASLYIALVSAFLFYVPEKLLSGKEDTVLAPISMLSLFVFSAALMAYIFFYQPLMMYLDGNKKASVNLFIQELLWFGALTLLFFAVAFLVR